MSEPTLTCAQATTAARAALLRLGYTVIRVDAARPGVPGTVVGERETGWSAATPEPGARYTATATVTVTCSDRGADFTAITDEGGLTQLDFPNRFTAALRDRIDTKPVESSLYDEEPQGLVVTVEPQRGRDALSEFGVDLPALGITPVHIRLENRSPRRYAFRTADVALVTVEGTRQAPLYPAAVAARVGARRDAAAVTDHIRMQAMRDGELAPEATLSGYLFLPAAAYQRVRVTVTDVETEEEEGVSAEF